MSVIITNVSLHDGSEAVSQYVVRVNTGPTIAEFAHWRGDGLARCLRLAADAVDAAGKTNPHADKAQSGGDR